MQQSQPHRGNKSLAKAKNRNGLLSGWWRFLRPRRAKIARPDIAPTPLALDLDRTSEQIEAEIWQNHRRIEAIQRQNALLSQQLAAIEHQQQLALSQDRDRLSTTPTKSPQRHPKFKSKRDSGIQTWLWIVVAVIVTAIVCGIVGFALTRSISMR